MPVIHKAKRIDPDTQLMKAPPTELVIYKSRKLLPWFVCVGLVCYLVYSFWVVRLLIRLYGHVMTDRERLICLKTLIEKRENSRSGTVVFDQSNKLYEWDKDTDPTPVYYLINEYLFAVIAGNTGKIVRVLHDDRCDRHRENDVDNLIQGLIREIPAELAPILWCPSFLNSSVKSRHR